MYRFIFFTFITLAAGDVSAELAISYAYNKDTIKGINAITGLEDVMSDCTQMISELIVEEVIYDGASDRIIGFRSAARDASRTIKTFPLKLHEVEEKLANSEKHYIGLLVKKGAKIFVTYQICGNGGFVSVKDIYAKSYLSK